MQPMFKERPEAIDYASFFEDSDEELHTFERVIEKSMRALFGVRDNEPEFIYFATAPESRFQPSNGYMFASSCQLHAGKLGTIYLKISYNHFNVSQTFQIEMYYEKRQPETPRRVFKSTTYLTGTYAEVFSQILFKRTALSTVPTICSQDLYYIFSKAVDEIPVVRMNPHHYEKMLFLSNSFHEEMEKFAMAYNFPDHHSRLFMLNDRNKLSQAYKAYEVAAQEPVESFDLLPTLLTLQSANV